MTKIKLCGMFRDVDIDYANEARPDYIGFIINFPKSHRNVSPSRAAELRAGLAPDIKAAGVFVNQSADFVAKAAKGAGLDAVQLHGDEDNGYISDLKSRIDIPVWKAFKIRSNEDLEKAENSLADEILLDNGYGTGKPFDWSLAKNFKRPFFLAGGLTPDNLADAIEKMNPVLVDLSSGIETDGVKDREKMLRAVAAARK